MKLNIYLLIFLCAFSSNNLIAQGVTKNGEITNTSTNFVDKNGKTGSVPKLNKKGQPLINVGEAFQGGIVAYVLQPGDPGYNTNEVRGLIAAPTDQSASAQWGCINTTVLSASAPAGNAIGKGFQNTLEIMAGCSTAGIAARICGDLDLGGYSDWYLPSLEELNKLYSNKSLIGGFSNAEYWSSSEGTAWYSYTIDFNNGVIHYPNKNLTYRVRAVRSF